MRSIKHPHSVGNIFLFAGFILMSYSAFIFATPEEMSGEVLATCVSDGAYGETCTEVESFEIQKWVRIKGNDSWVNGVTDVNEEDIVEFRVRTRNTGDSESDNMKMEDILPSEMQRIGGDSLIEEWDNFEVGAEMTFVIEAQLKASEFNTNEDFEKCVVNKAELYQDDDFIGSDTATVCYNNADVVLPETGSVSPMALGIFGLFSTISGAVLKRKVRK